MKQKSNIREQLRELHAVRKSLIRERLREFSHVRADDYFYELAYCLLTPQSSAHNAAKAIDLLRANRFQEHPIDPEPFLHRRECYIRFHRTKAKHLLKVKEEFQTILEHLRGSGTAPEHRAWLVQHVKGLGWKESSHFLRNIGHRDLAILDRHILRNLLRLGVLRQLPPSLTPRRYLAIEKKFQAFARVMEIPMDELDLLFWSRETGEILK